MYLSAKTFAFTVLLCVCCVIAGSAMQIGCTRTDRRTVVHAVEDIINVVCSDSDPLPLCLKKAEAYQAALDAGATKDEAKQKALAIKP
jgi:hypothetical protein